MRLSDLIVIYDYKEPLKAIPESLGFGYYGCISGTQGGTKIQCHICGLLFRCLSSHIGRVHNMGIREYQDLFSLVYETKLISPEFKKERRETYMQTFSKEEREKNQRKASKKAGRQYGKIHARPKLSLETLNKRGSCPDQIIAKILEVKKKLGHQPSQREFMVQDDGEKYFRYIRRTFKTWNEAIKVAGLTPQARWEAGRAYSKPERKPTGRRGYSKEELIEYLKLFKQEENRVPRCSDFGLGILPHIRTYQHHFKTLQNARSLANIY